jgi:hypothetical protein
MDDLWIEYFQSLRNKGIMEQGSVKDGDRYDTTGFKVDPSDFDAVDDMRNSRIYIGAVVQIYPSDGVCLVAFQFPVAERHLCIGLNGNNTPFGVKQSLRTSIGSTVLVYWDGDMNSFGYILGNITTDGTVNGALPIVITNRLSQISRSDNVKNSLNQTIADHIPMQYSNDGNICDDTALGDLTYSTLLGGILHIDAFQILMKMTERCSTLMSIFNGLLRHTAQTYQLWTPASIVEISADRKYTHHVCKTALYSWEALGALEKPGKFEEWTKSTQSSDESVANQEPKEEEMMPYCRMEEIRGWQGQGLLRQIKSLPDGGGKFFVPKDFDSNVSSTFRESIHVDGTYLLDAAGGIFLRRTVNIPCFIKVKDAFNEDKEKAEEELEQEIPHKLEQENGANHTLMQIDELLTREDEKAVFAYSIGEKSEEYKKVSKDPEEAKKDSLSSLRSKQFLEDSKTKKLKAGIDDTEIKYGERDQLFGMTNDGGLILRDAYGNEIRTGPGGIEFISCGDINIRSGRRTVVMAGDDVIMTANKSCDITAAQNDVRIAAYKNVEVTSGLAGNGRLLLENNATTTTIDTKDTVGEKVTTGGIVLTAPKSNIYQYSLNNYKKAKRSVEEVTNHYSWHSTYNVSGKQSVKFAIDDPNDDRKIKNALELTTSSVNTYGSFTANSRAFINGTLFIDASTTINGSLRVMGSATYTGSVTARNRQNGVIDADTAKDIKEATQEYSDAMTEGIDERLAQLENNLTTIYEQETDESKPLNQQLIDDIGYRGRDEKQFGTTEYVMMAPSFHYFDFDSVKGKFDLDTINNKLKDKHPEKEGDGVFPGRKQWEAEDSYIDLEEEKEQESDEKTDNFSEPAKSSLKESYIAVVIS